MKRTLLLGPPGTGKTTTQLFHMEQALNRGIKPHRIAFVSFTRAAIRDAKDLACDKFGLSYDELPLMRTLHSMCFHLLALKRGDVFGQDAMMQLSELTGELLTGKFEMDAPTLGERGDALLFLDQYSRSIQKPLEDAWNNHGAPIDWYRLKRFVDTYTNMRHRTGLLDFTDMIERAIEQDVTVDADLVLVDEAQDLSKLQWAFIYRAFRNVPEMIVSGDDDQCQPGDTLIVTEKGIKKLEDLDPNSDRLVVYVRDDSRIAGYRNGHKFTKSQRIYNGYMYTVESDEKKTDCTNNHKWLVRWTDEAKKPGNHAVYLMQRDNRFRVGHCQLFKSDNVFHVGSRANIEKADKVWILKIFPTKRESYVYEQIIAAKFEIPQCTFEPTGAYSSQEIVTGQTLDEIFDGVDSYKGGLDVLAFHKMLYDKPFINKRKENYSRFGAVIFEMEACNLFSNLMEIPIVNKENITKVIWKKLQISNRYVENVLVYGLDVEKYHTYIANGIVTHNCIYQWAGASSTALLDFDGTKEVLSQSYRLPRTVWEVARSVAAGIGTRYQKEFAPATDEHGDTREGHVEWLARPDEADLSAGRWLLLARTRRQLTGLAALAADQGVVYELAGRSSVDPQHVTDIKEYEKFRSGNPTMPLWHDALTGIPLETREYLLSCLRRDKWALTTAPRVRVDTIHGAKGLEADNVLLLTDVNARIRRGIELDSDAEARVWYVGVTRAREALYPVIGQRGRGYDIN